MYRCESKQSTKIWELSCFFWLASRKLLFHSSASEKRNAQSIENKAPFDRPIQVLYWYLILIIFLRPLIWFCYLSKEVEKIYVIWINMSNLVETNYGNKQYNQGICSLCAKTSYRQISCSFGAARSDVIMIVTLWNLTGISTALLPRYLSKFRAIGKVYTRSSRLRGFTTSCGKTFYCISTKRKVSGKLKINFLKFWLVYQ